MREELPAGWISTTLGQVVGRPRAKAAPSEYPDLPFVGMDSIAPNGMELLSVGRFGDMKSAGGIFEPGDVLYGRMRPYLNKVHRAHRRGACSAEFIVMPASDWLDGDFLAYLLHQRSFVNFARAQCSGDRPRVDFESLAAFQFHLPPRAEQERIISRIEELFSEIDEGERALDRVQLLVERYRQSVLKAAVTGELTNDWRAHHAPCESKHVESGRPSTLPPGWVWTQVARAGEVRLGRQRAPQHHQGDHMRPYLRVANVYEDRLDLTDVKEMNFTPKEFETYALRPGDILLNEGQSPELVGRPAMYRGEIPGCCYQKTLLRFRARPGVLPDFALLVFRHYLHSGRFRRSANITTSIAHLAAERFEPIEFPLPPESEQAAIVDSASALLGRLAHLEAELLTQRSASRALREATLKAAFSGELVLQDPTDEPASALLARLADGPSGTSPAPRRRGRPVEQAASNRRTESAG